MHKINYITNAVLKNNDIEVYNHLSKIEVSLHPFGIRWLRLLFLRELEFPSCLILWDAMFATDNKDFNLANYIFVALLTSIRDEILKMEKEENETGKQLTFFPLTEPVCTKLLILSNSFLSK